MTREEMHATGGKMEKHMDLLTSHNCYVRLDIKEISIWMVLLPLLKKFIKGVQRKTQLNEQISKTTMKTS